MYTVIYGKGESTWGACVPDLPCVIAAGDSREEAESLIRESVEFHIGPCFVGSALDCCTAVSPDEMKFCRDRKQPPSANHCLMTNALEPPDPSAAHLRR